VYNALGERVSKTVTVPAAITTRFVYDESSQLVAEYGATNRDIVWLGNLPVATVDGAGSTSTFGYIHSDALGTPRAAADANGATIWTWAYAANAFGEQQATSNGFVLNLRSPGQYFDAESGLNYNVNRDYEAATGRYIQSDPIGLAGRLNMYAYVGNKPLGYIDPLGLAPHHYTVTDFSCSVAQPGCTPQNVFDRLRQYPAPFSDPSHPINTGDTDVVPFSIHV
jgi:RHS repeat-associated protein